MDEKICARCHQPIVGFVRFAPQSGRRTNCIDGPKVCSPCYVALRQEMQAEARRRANARLAKARTP